LFILPLTTNLTSDREEKSQSQGDPDFDFINMVAVLPARQLERWSIGFQSYQPTKLLYTRYVLRN
jgi:hypothetical protein